jgi:hypothetical protein
MRSIRRRLLLMSLIAAIATAVIAESPLVTYSVSNFKLVSPETRDACDRLVDYVWSVVPLSMRSQMAAIAFFSTSAEDWIDGRAEPDNTGYWTISFDIDITKRVAYFDQVIAHELGHIVARSSYGFNDYMTQFRQRFWPNGTSHGFLTAYAATDEREDFCESFSYFVLDRETESPRTRFFLEYPVTAAYRVWMRQHMRSTQEGFDK